MVRTQIKALTLVIALILSLGLGAGLAYDVEIAQITDHSITDLEYSDEVENVQVISTTLENSGSIGCTYRLRADFEGENYEDTSYSEPYPVWPGQTSLVELYYIPYNFTGQMDTKVSINYCDGERDIEEFNFTVPEQINVNQTIESDTLTADPDSARVKLDIDEGLLVPKESPPLWKTYSATIDYNVANIRYDAPIFNEDETITFSVLNKSNSEVLGTTEVSLDADRSLMYLIRDNLFVIGFALSIIVNLALVVLLFRRLRK